MKYTLPKLNYGYSALEPYIDAQTMEIHHTKHHQGYVDNLNKVLEKYPGLGNRKLGELLRDLPTLDIPEADKTAIRNHGGGHLNHSFFWEIMSPAKEVDVDLEKEIMQKYGSLAGFSDAFNQSALTRFGSGWAWLVRNGEGQLKIYSTSNQDSPLMNNDTPLIGVDVWEHAYYLKYQNKRAQYLQNWWSVLKILP